MFNFVGYLINGPGGCPVPPYMGLAYNYMLAGNGLFVQADNQHIFARVPEAAVPIRGLGEVLPELTLKHGKIPQRLFDLALSVMLADPERERYVGIIWNDGYQLYVPEQKSGAARVEYCTADDVVVELHSHPGMAARFSLVDDKDEQGFKVYGVIGFILQEGVLAVRFQESINLRVGVYGYFMPVTWSDVFEGSPQDVADVNKKAVDG